MLLFTIGIHTHSEQAALDGCMKDSAGKFGIDQLDQATDDEKERMKQAEQAKAFPGQHIAYRENQQVCLYYTQKLVMQHELMPLSPYLVVYTKFPSKVFHTSLRVGLKMLA